MIYRFFFLVDVQFIFSSIACFVYLVSYLRNYRLVKGHEDLPLCFLLRALWLALLLKDLIYFDLISTNNLMVQLHAFACGYPPVPPLFVEETIHSEMNGLAENQLIIDLQISELSILFH